MLIMVANMTSIKNFLPTLTNAFNNFINSLFNNFINSLIRKCSSYYDAVKDCVNNKDTKSSSNSNNKNKSNKRKRGKGDSDGDEPNERNNKRIN